MFGVSGLLPYTCNNSLRYHQKLVREIFRTECAINADNDWIAHKQADGKEVARYNELGEGGPNLSNIHFDMLHSSHTSPWNNAIFAHLVNKFKEYVRRKGIILVNVDDDYIITLFENKFDRGRCQWKMALPKVTSKGSLETEEEIQARLKNALVKASARARADTRRRNVSIIFMTLTVAHCLCRNSIAGRKQWKK